MSISLQTLACGPMDNRTYLLTDQPGGETIVVDPGFDCEAILRAMKGKSPVGLLLTHAHFDHMDLIDKLRTLWGVPLWVSCEDSGALCDSTRNGNALFTGRDVTYAPAERTFSQGDKIPLGASFLTVYHTPGHTPGSCCFAVPGANESWLLTGDTLFRGSVGRTDLPGGSMTQMMESVNRLRVLGQAHPDWIVCPGHGAQSTLAQELAANPYFQ